MTHPPRLPIWLPYLDSITEKPKGQWNFVYKGGEEHLPLKNIQSIFIYGESNISMPISQIESIARSGIPIIIHRRNLAQPIYITGGERPDKENTIFYQLKKKGQSRYTNHIARQLLKAKMQQMQYLTQPMLLPTLANVNQLRNIEAVHARNYWKQFFYQLGYPEWHRRENNPASIALNAQSKFLIGILLRYILYHHLSPFHAFLHEPINYPTLAYDLLEPYRGLFEQESLSFWIKNHIKTEDYLTSIIENTKEVLDAKCYVPLTRQIVTKQELLQGIVLSLKYYLLGKQRKFLIPEPGSPKGGRPPKINFHLYGRQAGKTDFWQVAHSLSK